MNKRLAVISTHPIQYQAPLWRSLAKEIDIHVYFGSDYSIRGYKDEGFGVHLSWDVPLTEGYPHTFLSLDPGINRIDDVRLNMAEFKQKLLEFQPDYALLNGYSPRSFYLKAFLALRLLGIPILMGSDATDAAGRRSAVKAFSRNVFLKLLYSQVAGFLAGGYNTRQHYRSRGIPERRIFRTANCVDDELFAKQIEDYGGRRTEIRRKLGFDENQFVFIFSGKLTPIKNPLIIVEALRLLSAAASEVGLGLVVMGDGLLRQQFEAGMRALPGIATVFTGFQNQSKLGLFYSAADCLVLPSWSETWGLVVNEALQFGIPAIVSDMVGCWRDLVIPGETGCVFPTGDAAAMADCMSRVMSLCKLKENGVKEACRQKASQYSVGQWVAGMRKCLVELSQGG